MHEYAPIGTPPPPHASDSEPDLEAAALRTICRSTGSVDNAADTSAGAASAGAASAGAAPPEPKSDAEERKEAHSNGIVSIKQAGFREIGGAVAAAAPMTAERMAAIAASMAY